MTMASDISAFRLQTIEMHAYPSSNSEQLSCSIQQQALDFEAAGVFKSSSSTGSLFVCLRLSLIALFDSHKLSVHHDVALPKKMATPYSKSSDHHDNESIYISQQAFAIPFAVNCYMIPKCQQGHQGHQGNRGHWRRRECNRSELCPPLQYQALIRSGYLNELLKPTILS